MQTTGSRPKLVVSADGRGVVSHAGSRLLADLADGIGLTGAFTDGLRRLRPRGTGHNPGRIAVDLAVMLADGGEAIADLALLRDQTEVRPHHPHRRRLRSGHRRRPRPHGPNRPRHQVRHGA